MFKDEELETAFSKLTDYQKDVIYRTYFLDLDDKEEAKKMGMTVAEYEKTAKDKKEDKGGKGLTAAQKKLPEGLRKAIEAKKKK